MQVIIGKISPINKEQKNLLTNHYFNLQNACKYAYNHLIQGISPRYIFNDIKDTFHLNNIYAVEVLYFLAKILDPIEGYLNEYLAYLYNKLNSNKLSQKYLEQEFDFYNSIDKTDLLKINFKELNYFIEILQYNKEKIELIYSPKKILAKLPLYDNFYNFKVDFDINDYIKLKNSNINTIDIKWYGEDFYLIINNDLQDRELLDITKQSNSTLKWIASLTAVLLSSANIPVNANINFEPKMYPPVAPSNIPFMEPTQAPPMLPQESKVEPPSLPPVIPTASPINKVLKVTNKNSSDKKKKVIKVSIKNTSQCDKFYTVKQGDTLYSISKNIYGQAKYWNKIALINKISYPYTIYPNQKLILPNIKTKEVYLSKTSKKYKTYTVQRRDSLYKIAKKVFNNGNKWIEIYKLNKNKLVSPTKLKIGQVLILP